MDLTDSGCRLKVLIIAEHASAQFGGEAILPLHYFRLLLRRGYDVRMVVHERTAAELTAMFPSDINRITFVADTAIHRWLHWAGRRLPRRLSYMTTGFMIRCIGQRSAIAIARDLVRRYRIDVVHQPIPVSPREPSLLYGVGAPVVIGPLNGGMEYPLAFRRLEGWMTAAAVAAGRAASGLLNRLLPGKRRAALILVANERTRQNLPGASVRVETLVENGVDLTLWTEPTARPSIMPGRARFAFVGRLVDWKALELAIEAIAVTQGNGSDVSLDVLGDGPMRSAWEALANRLGVANRVAFHGWCTQSECADRLRTADGLVLPSVYECGGAVVLEAMALGLPVIATDWGGPADYLDSSCGILVPPTGRDEMVAALADAMTRLARSPELRQQMGAAGRRKVETKYDWEKKVDRMIEFYQFVAAGNSTPLQ